MAHTKSGAKAKQKTPRPGKRLGIKKNQNQSVAPGNIIIRQRGSQFHPGKGTKMGKDYTIFAVATGAVNFLKRQGKKLVEVVS
ncbi:MAG: 50S ribosomal protein L27 [Candidatus Shapirobacteria bacterium]|nr:50S ribosomal protein L27 [Candidatus Shapirobacteria bacterium]MDD5073737.1 50S ribosomal protein L27 [Candidatus Shapirobacteria bacterium]MDD5481662.1 50S ribosomal protein L27 [Candidatus Shapirobacteria bacterium]